jgi:uncharacterized protein
LRSRSIQTSDQPARTNMAGHHADRHQRRCAEPVGIDRVVSHLLQTSSAAQRTDKFGIVLAAVNTGALLVVGPCSLQRCRETKRAVSSPYSVHRDAKTQAATFQEGRRRLIGGFVRYCEGVRQVSYAVRDNHAVWAGLTLRAWTDVLVETLVSEFDPVSIILFGSVAVGSDGPDSDIDLLVVLDDAPLADRRRTMVRLRRATRSIAAPHDLLVTSAADFARNATRPGTTEYEPAQHGVAVYERVAA